MGCRSSFICAPSFDPATPVLLVDGSTKPIGQVAVGDVVLATDPQTLETKAQEVLGWNV